jgi:adenylate kinase family enzyme
MNTSLGNRIAIIGNAGGGKSTLARKLGTLLDLPVTHVDSIQYQPGWSRTPDEECDKKLATIANEDRWIIDGFGNDPIIESRVKIADTILFVDFPIWRHYWWAFKRQLASRKGQRKELPDDCEEFTFDYTKKLIKVMWLVHKEYTPWFRSLVDTKLKTGNAIVLRNPDEIEGFIRDVAGETNLRPNNRMQPDAAKLRR